MKIAYVVLYLSFGGGGVVEVPEKFPSMEACQASFEGTVSKSTGAPQWRQASNGIPVGTCVPVMGD